MTVTRIYGRSSGAIAGVLMCCGITDSSDILNRVQQYNQTLHIVDSWAATLADLLPVDAYATCSGRLFITTAWCGVVPCTVSDFKDNAHLLKVIVASGRIPLITTKTFGLHLDGAFVERMPFFSTRSMESLPILYIRAPHSCWSISQTLSARLDICEMQRTIYIGERMTRDFLQTGRSPTNYFQLLPL
jgi:predicted acylesterase/phospholipase RssA